MRVLLCLVVLASAEYREKLRAFSFDTAYGEYPIAYKQFGASVGLRSKMKLIPAAPDTSGAIFLN